MVWATHTGINNSLPSSMESVWVTLDLRIHKERDIISTSVAHISRVGVRVRTSGGIRLIRESLFLDFVRWPNLSLAGGYTLDAQNSNSIIGRDEGHHSRFTSIKRHIL